MNKLDIHLKLSGMRDWLPWPLYLIIDSIRYSRIFDSVWEEYS